MPAAMNQNSVKYATPLQIRIARASAIAVMPTWCRTLPEDNLATPEIPESTGKVAKAEIKYLSHLILQLVQLRLEETSDDHGILRLDEEVFRRACDLLINAAITLMSEYDGVRMPHGCASTDWEGGMRVEWVRDDMSVHLVLPLAHGSIPPYMFHKFGNVKTIVKPVSPSSLAHLLSQIID